MPDHKTLSLSVEDRKITGKKVKQLRKTDIIPAIIYGKKKDNKTVSINKQEFLKVLSEVGETGLIEVNLNNQAIPCLIRQIQYIPVKNKVIHADLYAVDLKEQVEADILLSFIGSASAVEELDGTLIEVKSEVRVEALPADLVHEIEVDISPLRTFEDTLHIKDIKIPSGITILNDPEETIALVEPPRSEEELMKLEQVPVSEAEAVAKVESETKEGTSEAPAEEGTKRKTEATSEEKS